MLRRIILGVAIVAALAAVGVNIFVVRPKIIQLQGDRDSQRTQKEQYHTQLVKTQSDLKQTQASLKQTQDDLVATKADRDKIANELTQATTQIAVLNTNLDKTKQQLSDTQDQLGAYKNTGMTPQEIVALDKELKNTQNALIVANDEKTILTRTVNRLNNQIELLIGKDYVVHLPASLKGTVMAVDPKWNFVVLNVGEDQGVMQQGEMLVSRDGRLVAKVIVSSVQKDRCIANLVPGWQLGDIIEGDQVTPAHPAT